MRAQTARYPGFCRRCRRAIARGERILHLGTRLSVHEICPRDKGKQAAAEVRITSATRQILDRYERAGFR